MNPVSPAQSADVPWRGPTIAQFLKVGAISGAGIGLLDALLTLGLGFGPSDAMSMMAFVVICTALALTVGTAIGALMAVVLRVLRVFGFLGWERGGTLLWRRFSVSPRLWIGAGLAGLWAGLTFVFVFQTAPLFGASMLGNEGFLQPFSAEKAAMLGIILLATAAVFALVYWEQTHRRAAWIFGGLGIAMLAWQVFYQVYIVSYLPPTRWIHALQTGSLFALVAAGWLYIRYFDTAVGRGNRAVATTLAFTVVFTPLLAGFAIERGAGDSMRLQLHERTVVTARILAVMPDVLGPGERQIATDCEMPDDVEFQPDNCPDTGGEPAVDGVVLVVVDTLREDRIRARRDGQPLMRNLREFADEHHEFQRAYAPSASTRGSFGAIKSGEVSAIDTRAEQVGELLLDEALSKAGIWTGAVPAHTHITHIVDGFDYVDTSIIESGDLRFANTDGQVTERAVEALDAAPDDGAFFLLVHYFGPHAYYLRHDAYDFGWSAVSRYDSEVANTDEKLGELLDYLDTERADDDIAVIVTSDHGEEFFDHRYSHHGVRLYNEMVHIPLVIDVPFAYDCELCETPVSLGDLAPTVASLFGMNPQPFGEASAMCLHGSRVSGVRPVLMRATDRRGVVFGDHKFIDVTSRNIRQLYDLRRDPDERSNLANEKRERARELSCILNSNR